VRDKRATWADSAQTWIRFNPNHREHKAVTAEILMRINTGRSYDRIQRALTTQELRGIPFVGDVHRLMVL